jgi:hypothetical protein
MRLAPLLAASGTVLLFGASALAADVWVSADSGSDSNAGTEQAPLATIERAFDEETNDPRLTVHLLPGTYREFARTSREGTHLVVAPGDRGQVVLTGAEPSASFSWTQTDPAGLPAAAAGQVWAADLTGWELPPQIVLQLQPNGDVLRLTPAREPDWEVTTEWKVHEHWETSGMAPTRYWADETAADEHSAHYLSSAFLTQAALGDLTGGRIWVKDAISGHDTYSAGIIGHFAGEGTVELSRECHISNGDDGLGEDSKFYVEGKATLLDQEGEWYYDAAASRIYLWPVGGGDPGTLSIEITRREQGLSVDHGDFLVDGLVFRGFNYEHDYWNTRASALYVQTQSDALLRDVTVRNCVMEHAGRGLHAVASTSGGMVTLEGLRVEDSTIRHVDGQAINVQSWPNDIIGVRDITVERCLVRDAGFRNPEPTDSMGGMSFSRVGDLRFLDNEVDYTPHNSVQLNYGLENILIKGNHIHRCGLNAADNGCVKFWNNTDHYDPAAPRTILATENLLHDSMGWAYSSEVNEWWQTTGLSGSGFYCDYYRGATFYRNIIHTVGATALWPNTPSNHNWSIHNTVVNARHGASCSRQSMSTPDQGEALVMNNLFMGFTTWGFPADHYWSQLESGLVYSRTDDLLLSHHNGYHDVALAMLYVDQSNSGNRYATVAEVQAETSYEEGSVDLPGEASTIVADLASYDVHPVDGSPVIDAGGELPPEIADLFARLGLTLPPPEGEAYDLGAIEGTGGEWLRVTYPNGGEILPTGGEATVTWESAAFIGPVRIELATTYSSTPEWQTLVDVTANDGSELVTLPAIHDPSCRIRISEAADGAPEDLSDADFEIGDAILVTAPAGGESLTVGQSFSITWSSGGVTDIDIELSRDSGASWEPVAQAVAAADGEYPWTVTGPAAAECVVRLSDSADADPVGLSEGTFAIVDPAAAAAASEDEGGCDCGLAGRPARGARSLLLLAVVAAVRWRRRRPAERRR